MRSVRALSSVSSFAPTSHWLARFEGCVHCVLPEPDGRCQCCSCAGAWCCLEMPCCIGAILRRRLALALGQPRPPFLMSCAYNHCLVAPCSLCQEARIVQAEKYSASESPPPAHRLGRFAAAISGCSSRSIARGSELLRTLHVNRVVQRREHRSQATSPGILQWCVCTQSGAQKARCRLWSASWACRLLLGQRLRCLGQRFRRHGMALTDDTRTAVAMHPCWAGQGLAHVIRGVCARARLVVNPSCDYQHTIFTVTHDRTLYSQSRAPL